MAQLIITIDGPAASGKSTMARLLADRLGATFLDTGAMYRAITLAAVRDGADLADEQQLVAVGDRHRFDFEAARGQMLVRIDGSDVTEAIRDNELTAKVRHAASAPLVRARLVDMQRAFAARHDKIVTEGRDQGTVVFPGANVKFYLTASAAERARRRAAELRAKGIDADLRQMQQEIERRDRSDESRAVGPLKPAADAIPVDTTGLSIQEAIERLYGHVQARLGLEADKPDRGPTVGSSPRPSGQTDDPAPPRVTRDKAGDNHAARRTLHAARASKFAWYWLARLGCRMFCALVFRYRAYGGHNIPEHGSFILASNHQSYLDPVFCGVAIRRHLTYVARDTLFRYRLFAWLIGSLDAIPIGRDKADIAAMKTIITRLREGAGVCLYPEGTRTRDGRIVPVKPGFGLLCRRSKATVVPALIDGGFETWPRHRRFFEPGAVTVQFGKPMTPAQIAHMTNGELADHLTRTLRQMQHEVRSHQGRKPYDYKTP